MRERERERNKRCSTTRLNLAECFDRMQYNQLRNSINPLCLLTKLKFRISSNSKEENLSNSHVDFSSRKKYIYMYYPASPLIRSAKLQNQPIFCFFLQQELDLLFVCFSSQLTALVLLLLLLLLFVFFFFRKTKNFFPPDLSNQLHPSSPFFFSPPRQSRYYNSSGLSLLPPPPQVSKHEILSYTKSGRFLR
jgi:hypothetical protein